MDSLTDARKLRFPRYTRRLDIPEHLFLNSHIQLCGATRTGKGAMAGRLLHNRILCGDAVYVLDPKKDDWLPSVLADACARAGVGFHFIDLECGYPQFNLLRDIRPLQEEELYIAGLDFESTDKAGVNFYHTAGRERIHEIAQHILPRKCLLDAAVWADMRKGKKDDAAGLINALNEVSRVPAIATWEGVDLAEPIRNGGCVYVCGSMFHDAIKRIMRMVLIRIIQLVRDPERNKRHVCISVDEVKHQLHQPFLTALSTLLGFGGSMMIMHQSHGEFPSIEMKATVLDNTAIKFVFRAVDETAAAWAAGLTGNILIEGNHQRHYIDTNMMQQLYDGDSIVVGIPEPWRPWRRARRLAKRIRVVPVKVEKHIFTPVKAPEVFAEKAA